MMEAGLELVQGSYRFRSQDNGKTSFQSEIYINMFNMFNMICVHDAQSAISKDQNELQKHLIYISSISNPK